MACVVFLQKITFGEIINRVNSKSTVSFHYDVPSTQHHFNCAIATFFLKYAALYILTASCIFFMKTSQQTL